MTPRSPLPFPSPTWGVFLPVLCVASVLLLCHHGRAQQTDAAEVTALNSIFDGWQISASGSSPQWNTSGDPCSGAAVFTTVSLTLKDFNPAIKCNCSFNSNSICHITDLKIDRLKAIGNIPEDITNLTFLRSLNVRGNALTGIIPSALGSLQNLVSLDLGMNNFNGSLPGDLGNLINLQELRLDSLGEVSGEIPTTFGNLKNLRIMWASDNNFTGRIPDFIGNLTELTDLRFQGNSFEGPIPSTYADLTKLVQLHIGELSNRGSNLAFVENMKALNTLILRNTKISGALPLHYSFTNLKHMDLSFNNLTGPLPETLLNLASLQRLFLGNNSLSGSLPSKKNPALMTIDLSYNELSGSLPAWVNDSLDLNLVANNLTISNSSVFPYLECLQRNGSCHHGSSYRSSFAINCGGDIPVTAVDGSSYDIDNKNLATASYYVSNNSWAVSSVGNFSDAQDYPSYILKTETRFLDTQNSELFQWARQSASSLRYYGFGLLNGSYKVKLQFGEREDWILTARRLFDIYIQGNRVISNFDITKQAGGVTRKPVVLTFDASVLNNFLEIHFFWAGKGTCCMPTNGIYGISVSAISVTPNFTPPETNLSPTKKNRALTAGMVAFAIALFLVMIFGLFIWKRKKREPGMDNDEEFRGLTVKPNSFTYAELRAATEDFSSTNKLGQGGCGVVYKGVLSDGKEVAIKKLSVASVQAKKQFITEIATISAVQHRNLVKLFGCCYEGGHLLLVYEYLTNKSLDQVLFGNRNMHLDWSTRFGICLGAARGLAYLHEESSTRIVHRDVKSSNILLDSNFNPKVADFGLAKLHDENKSHISTGVAGTVGYLAPEYAMRGQLTEKVDVFGFGVVALEILSGRKNYDPSLGEEKMYLLEWAWHLHQEKHDLEIVDPILPSYDAEEATRMIGVALLCTQSSALRRPSMSRVVAMLVGDIEIGEITGKPNYLWDWRCSDNSSTGISSAYSASATSGNFVPQLGGTAQYSPSQAYPKPDTSEGR